MRLNHLFVENFQGLRLANLELQAPITLVAGPNGAGKSSLQEAINLALGGQTRVALKKDYKQLITDGQDKAQIIVSHDDVASSYSLPAGKGDHTTATGDEYLQSVVEPEEWLELDGLSDQAWRERIGNAVPPAAAEAIAQVMGTTLLLAEAGETFMLSNMPVWVRPVAVGLSVSQHQIENNKAAM
ncbi:hypothetical protein AO265_17380 [Pseudomonas sp. ABAC61]|nr:hypothetical protein AO265_17380 [Pseudomonas sp. ABAC61]